MCPPILHSVPSRFLCVSLSPSVCHSNPNPNPDNSPAAGPTLCVPRLYTVSPSRFSYVSPSLCVSLTLTLTLTPTTRRRWVLLWVSPSLCVSLTLTLTLTPTTHRRRVLLCVFPVPTQYPQQI